MADDGDGAVNSYFIPFEFENLSVERVAMYFGGYGL